MRGTTTGFLIAGFFTATMPGANASSGNQAGHYYNVPVEVTISSSPAGRQVDAITSESARLLVYSRDNGSTAVQLMVSTKGPAKTWPPNSHIQFPKEYVTGYTLYRDDVPPDIAYVFGSLDKLTIPYNPMNRHLANEGNATVDLTAADGGPTGRRIQFSDAAGEPATEIRIEYSTQGPMGQAATTGTAVVTSDGYFIQPQPSFIFQNRASVPSLKLTAIEPVSGTAYELDNRLRMHSNFDATSVTLPFLNDWEAAHPNVDIYAGQIFTADDKPASHAEFSVQAVKYSQTDSSYWSQRFTAGDDGRFRLAFKQPAASQVRGNNSPADISLSVEGAGERYALIPGSDIEVRRRRTKQVTVELLDANGGPLDFSTTPVIFEYSRIPNFVGVMFENPNGRGNGHGGSVSLELDANGTSLEPVSVSVPGTYLAMARHYAFEPVTIGISDDKVQFKPRVAPFTISGKIVDLAGQPIPDAYVFAGQHWIIGGMGPDFYQPDFLSKMYRQTDGNPDKLGAYLQKTDQSGSFSISGNSLSNMAAAFVRAEGFGDVSFEPQIRAAAQTERGLFSMPFRQSGENLSGEIDLGTITLARQATLTLTLNEHPDPEHTTASRAMAPYLRANIGAEFLKFSDYKSTASDRAPALTHNLWGASTVITTESVTLSVPAETTMTVSLNSSRSGSHKQYRIEITEPLKPGEVRDIGKVDAAKALVREEE